ncbi:MAG: ClbS/DfsB family four-helix bundle protein [Propionibacteriaceae bacterium]|jgi:hypothetical protein|nr:ClbS/DfsB family four-helix bundle protein [Propionibacteriaceae bacterium]
MSRPTTRQQLLDAAASGYDDLMTMAASLPDDVKEGPFSFEDRDRNLRDVLVHLTKWHDMMLRWYADGMSGTKPVMPAPGYTWKTTAALNAVIWENAQDVPLAQAIADLAQSHQQVLALIEGHTDEELFTKKYYPWTGTTSLGSYLVSSTSSHYDWAITKLRKAVRAANQTAHE